MATLEYIALAAVVITALGLVMVGLRVAVPGLLDSLFDRIRAIIAGG